MKSPECGLRALVPEEFHQSSLQPTLLLVFLDGTKSTELNTREAPTLESGLKRALERVPDRDYGIVKSGCCWIAAYGAAIVRGAAYWTHAGYKANLVPMARHRSPDIINQVWSKT